MARTPHKPAATLPEPSTVAEAHAMTISEDLQAQDIERNMVFEAGQRVGGVNSALFLRACADRVVVEEFDKLSKHKAYRAIQFRDESGNLRRCADLDEFCKLYFGSAYRTVKELSDNYHLIGAELYERAEKLGFRRDDYRSLKALPADDQAIIKQAMGADTDRDQVIDLLQEMAARHASEKAALTAETTEAKETAEARDAVIKAKEETISKLELRATSAERRRANFTDIEEAGYECAPLHEAVAETIVGLKKIEREVARLTQEVGGELVLEECYTAVLVAAKRAVGINDAYRLGITGDAVLGELTEDEREALELKAVGLHKAAA